MIQTADKILLNKSTLSKDYDKNLFENISWSWGNFNTHHDVATALKDKNPYTITVLIDSLKSEYMNRKDYVKKTRIPIESKYRELLYDYFFQEFGRDRENIVYGEWLEKYRPQHEKERKYEFVDEYIVKHEFEPRYRAKILKRFKNQEKLFKERIKIERDRYYKLPEPLNRVDWRNPYDNIFVWEESGKKEARRGGSGSSGSREVNSKFIYGLLELNKIRRVPSYLFLYSEENTLLFIKRFESLCVPFHDLGSNYHLDSSEDEKLKQNGMFILWDVIGKIKEVRVGSYKQLLSKFSSRFYRRFSK